MSDTPTTEPLLARLDAAQPRIARRDMYYRGDQPLTYTAGKIDPAKFRFHANICRVAVRAVAERVRLTDVAATLDGRDVTERARRLVQDADLPMLLESIVTDMLAVGSAYLIVWPDGQGRPSVTGETAEQVIVERDPVTRGVVAAVKMWRVYDAHNVETAEHVVKYEPTRITHLVRDASTRELKFHRGYDNPLGVVPVVPLINIDRIGDEVGASVIDDLAPLVDALNKIMADMLVTSESVARPKRWATGIDLEEENTPGDPMEWSADMDSEPPRTTTPGVDEVRAPFDDADDMWVTEAAEAKFGQLAGADLDGYKTAAEVITQQIMAVSSLPSHMVGITTSNPSTAEALRASEVSLASLAASRIRVITRPVEWAVRLLVALDTGADPADVDVTLTWADPSTRSIAQEADAAAKLHAEDIITTAEARETVGTDQGI